MITKLAAGEWYPNDGCRCHAVNPRAFGMPNGNDLVAARLVRRSVP